MFRFSVCVWITPENGGMHVLLLTGDVTAFLEQTVGTKSMKIHGNNMQADVPRVPRLLFEEVHSQLLPAVQQKVHCLAAGNRTTD